MSLPLYLLTRRTGFFAYRAIATSYPHLILTNSSLSMSLPLHLSLDCLDELHIVRLPRIGRGKHNVHLDPYESDEHQAVCAVMDACNIPTLLSQHTGKVICCAIPYHAVIHCFFWFGLSSSCVRYYISVSKLCLSVDLLYLDHKYTLLYRPSILMHSFICLFFLLRYVLYGKQAFR